MKDLLSLTKRENCFYTVDGRTLCTINELHDYLNNCNPDSYYYHVNNGRNDFAAWIRDVLLFNDLSSKLFGTKNYDEAKTEVKKFKENFDIHASTDKKNNSFMTYDEYILRNLQELYYYLINCDESVYNNHVASGRNDFAKWVDDIFMLKSLSQKMYLSKNKYETITLLRDFLINGNSGEQHDEYLRYLKELSRIELMNSSQELNQEINQGKNQETNTPKMLETKSKDNAEKESNNMANKNNIVDKPENKISDVAKTIHNTINGMPIVGGLQNLEYTKNVQGEISSNNINADSKNISNDVSQTTNVQTDNIQTNNIQNNVSQINGNNVVQSPQIIPVGPDGEERLQLKQLGLDREDEEENSNTNSGPLLDPSKFHSFSDEELEQFSKFSKREKEIEEPSIKLEYLKSAYNELHSMIKDLRRAEKDALIAELMLRSINPKIDYYAITKNIQDYNHIIKIMKEVQKEIEEASVIQQHNLAEDIFKELRLQGIAMKKA